MEELVSVVLTTHKRRFQVLSRAIKSELIQEYINLELIIVDDSPNDYQYKQEVATNIKAIDDKRIKYIQHRINQGACAARNTGIRCASGEYIAFLDDDDEWLPTKLQKQMGKLDNPKVRLVYCSYYIYNNGKRKLKRIIKTVNVFNNLLFTNFIGSLSCVIVNRQKLFKVGLFDEKLPASQDYDLYLRLSKHYLIESVDEPLIAYYEHDGERISGNPHKKLEAREYLYDKFKEDIQKVPKIDSEKYLLIAHSYSQINRKKLKWKYWFKAVAKHPVPSAHFLKYTIKLLINR